MFYKLPNFPSPNHLQGSPKASVIGEKSPNTEAQLNSEK